MLQEHNIVPQILLVEVFTSILLARLAFLWPSPGQGHRQRGAAGYTK